MNAEEVKRLKAVVAYLTLEQDVETARQKPNGLMSVEFMSAIGSRAGTIIFSRSSCQK